MKYVLVSGGVISGVGKGIIASSTGLLLKTMGLKHVSSIKIDPYLNVDAGTMNPKEHGEVFVLDDGGEVDLDLGNYERYLNITLTRENNITTGKVYQQVIEKERRGDYLGRTVQVVPHITDAIMAWIERVAKVPVDDTKEEPDVCIVELGGTVGDIESMPFIEAITGLRRRAGKHNFLQIHVSYIPVIHGEQKTKPTQQAIRAVRSAGLFPDLIACRCERSLEASTVEKIAHFCQVDTEQVVVVRDMPSIYQVPVLLEQQGLLPLLEKKLRLEQLTIPKGLEHKGQDIWNSWKSLTSGAEHKYYEPVSIALVGKYTEFHDSYTSVIKALEHSAMLCRRKLEIRWIDSEHLEQTTRERDPAKYHHAWHAMCTSDGVLVPGGFGVRGTEGMIAAAKWARENKCPYLGICLGMQIAVIEYARNVCGFTNATSAEFLTKKEKTPHRDSAIPTPVEPSQPEEGTSNTNAPDLDARTEHPVIAFMPEIDPKTLGGTMRLGLRRTMFQPGSEWSKMRKLYGNEGVIRERHRHRYEVSPEYIERVQEYEAGGLHFVGKDSKGTRMEIVEIKEHPFFVGVQFHPEYLSRVLAPSRPYLGLVAASSKCLDNVIEMQLKKPEGNVLNGINGIKEGF